VRRPRLILAHSPRSADPALEIGDCDGRRPGLVIWHLREPQGLVQLADYQRHDEVFRPYIKEYIAPHRDP
jgi:hypothetical protein